MPVVKPGVPRQTSKDHCCPWTYPGGFKVAPKRAGREPLRARKSVDGAGASCGSNVTAGWATPADRSRAERSSVATARAAPSRCMWGGSPGPRRNQGAVRAYAEWQLRLCKSHFGTEVIGATQQLARVPGAGLRFPLNACVRSSTESRRPATKLPGFSSPLIGKVRSGNPPR